MVYLSLQEREYLQQGRDNAQKAEAWCHSLFNCQYLFCKQTTLVWIDYPMMTLSQPSADKIALD
jgi:hypothetical protein